MRRGVIRALRRDQTEIFTTSEMAMRSELDDRQLAFAAERGWVIVTANGKDYTRLHKEWMAAGRTHAGIIVSPQWMPIGTQVRALRRLLDTFSAEEMADRCEYLTGWLGDSAG